MARARWRLVRCFARLDATAIALFAVLAGCGGGGGDGQSGGSTGSVTPPPPPAPQASSIVPVSSASVAGAVASAVPITVRVTSTSGAPVANVAVSFSAASGSVSAATAATSTDGTASTTWTLGTQAGAQTLTASVASLSPVTFTATATASAAARMSILAGDGQTALAGTQLSTLLQVSIADQYGNPVNAQQVQYSVTAGGGNVDGATSGTVATAASGVASLGKWTLGWLSAAQSVRVTASTLPAVVLTATAKSPWLVTHGTGLTMATVSATEPGYADSQTVPWSQTRLGSPPTVGVACFDDGTVWVSLYHSRLVSKSGAVAYSFDGGNPLSSIWAENPPTYNMLTQTNVTLSRAYVSLMQSSSTYRLAFAEYAGSTYVATFDIRGLNLALPEVMAKCP